MTDFFSSWCEPPKIEAVGRHTSRVIVSTDDAAGIDAVVALLPQMYAKRKNLTRIAERYGKTGVANLMSAKVPQTKRALRI